MQWIKTHRNIVVELLFLIVLFFVSQLPLRDFDIWFHIKSGELFVKQGYLSTIETFSYSAAGREWTTFEWLFQIISYFISQIGLWAIPPFISVFVVIGCYFLLRIMSNIYRIPLIPRLVLAFAFWVSTYEFNTARPHTIAYTFLIIVLYTILARIHLNKRWVWWTPLLTLIWSNIHSTGFLSWGFMLAFGLVAMLQWSTTKQSSYKQTARDLLMIAAINAGVTLLPPMGLADYRLLWRFFRQREFLGYFIAEWGPPSDNPFGLKIYTTSIIVTLLLSIFISIRDHKIIQNLTGIPFIVMAIGGYTATRNIYLGTLGLVILFGSNIQAMLDWFYLKTRYWVTALFVIGFLIFYSWVYALKYDSIYRNRLFYPLQATEFIKSQNIAGNMFNDYNYGAYMLYRIYPTQKVFIDGRADVYECCEMRDYLKLAENKRMEEPAYRAFLNTMWDKYDISYAVIVTTKHNVMRRIATLLNTDADWALVFWDDDSQIFVRHDGKNTALIEQYGVKAATPYLRNPYQTGSESQALAEYLQMDNMAKSARTSNAIGFLMLKENKFDEAKKRFEEAISLDPTFESPYMNLAELAAKDGKLDEAITLYYQAQKRAFDRGLIYIRLGQLVIQRSGDTNKAKQVWNEGLKYTVDEDAKKRLTELLSTL